MTTSPKKRATPSAKPKSTTRNTQPSSEAVTVKPVTKASPTTKLKLAEAPAKQPSGDQVLSRKDLIEKVMVTGGLKRNEARKAVDAVGAVISATLTSGDSLKLVGGMKLRPLKKTDKGDRSVINVKAITRTDADAGADVTPLAKPKK